MSDVIHIPISPAELEECKQRAEMCAIGGRSEVRHDREERLAELDRDQLTKELGELAGSKYWFGAKLGNFMHEATHLGFNGRGDGGHDILGCNIDFKACRWPMVTKIPFEKIFLPVRPHERHKGWVYVFVLAALTVGHIVGYSYDHELPAEPNGTGVFEGACCVGTPRLHALPKVEWSM